MNQITLHRTQGGIKGIPKHQVTERTLNIIVPPGPETLWPYIRDVGERQDFTAADIAFLANATVDSVDNYLRCLCNAGLVASAGLTTENTRLWQLTTKRQPPPFVNERGGTDYTAEVMARVWTAFKMGKTFSLSSLLIEVDDNEFPVNKTMLSIYLRGLVKAGYLEELPAEQELGEKNLQLTGRVSRGPLAPRLYNVVFGYDPNTGRISTKQAVAEEVRL